MTGLRLDLIVRTYGGVLSIGDRPAEGFDRWTWRMWSNSRIVSTSGAQLFERHGGYVPRSLDVQRRLLGLPVNHGMTGGGMRECVPPSYAEHIGRLAHARQATTTGDAA